MQETTKPMLPDYNSNPQNAKGAAMGRSRDVTNTGWAGMGSTPSGINTLRSPVGQSAVGAPNYSYTGRQPNPNGTPYTDPPTGTPTGGNTGNTNLPLAGSYQTPNGLTQPIPAGGMNPNPNSVQQWQAPSAQQAAQGFTTAPDGPLNPEYQNMQANVQAGIAKNSQKPANFSIATNDPNVWMSPEGGTWITPGYSYGDKTSQVFGTQASTPFYDLPGGTYWQNSAEGPNSGALTQVNSPQQALDILKNNYKGWTDPYAAIGSFFAGQPIRTQSDITGASQVGQKLFDNGQESPNNASQTKTGPGGTQTQPQTSQPTQTNNLDTNTMVLLSSLLGNNGGNILAQIMNGTYKAPQQTPQQQSTVNIGGQQMRWDPANNYYVPVNPLAYGQGGGEST